MPDSLDPLFALYRESFPESERRPEPDLRRALATPAYRVLTKEDQGQLLGFAILFIPSGDDFALLEYLAVRPTSRSQGIGRALVSSAIQTAADRSLLTEIESLSPDPATARRQQFYRQQGFNRIDNLRYQLPLPGNPPPMELWIYPPSSVDRPQLSRWLTTVYTGVYGCPADDHRIAQMLNCLG
jgi:GNAT superfamily N-acetyltransferase